MTPRFFIDTAEPEHWQALAGQGWLYGATTNPLILKAADLPCSIETAKRLHEQSVECGWQELQFQVVGSSAADYIDMGRQISAIGSRMTVKLPAHAAGFEAARVLAAERCRITLTACTTPAQCALARVLGLDYVAPYYGRLLDNSIDADARLAALQQVIEPAGTPRLLIASVRTAEQFNHLLGLGHKTFTLRPEVAYAASGDALSDVAIRAFGEAAAGWEPVR